MREFVLPFKPEELLAQPPDGRLWAADLPPVDEWSPQEAGRALDALVGRVLKTAGRDIAEDASFSLLFALLQAWPRLEDPIQPRVSDLLADAARRISAETAKRHKESLKASASAKEHKANKEGPLHELLTAAKVAIFFLRWLSEKLIKQSQGEAAGGRGRGKGGRRGNTSNPALEASVEEARETQKAQERQRCAILSELSGLVSQGSMPWLWTSAPAAWQQIAQSVSDAGFLVLDVQEALKHRETRHTSLQCITRPLLQQGHQHSNLLVATVSKLMHGLRGGEGSATFAAEVMLQAHATPLPRLFLVELTQHCTGAELVSQGAFQRAIGNFLVAMTERLPHIILANISVLLPLLDVDCYPLRSAIVESIGTLLSAQGRKLPSGAHCEAQKEQGDQAGAESEAIAEHAADTTPSGSRFAIAQSTRKDLLETLMTRSLDKSVWVRYRALQTLTSLAANTKVVALPRDQWSQVLEIATRRMQDMASSTRKASMQLVRTLIEFHPYGPTLQGSGNERNKATQLMQEVTNRIKKLQAEEVAEAEAEAAAAGITDSPDGEEGDEAESALTAESAPATKRRRIKEKTVTEQTVDNDINQCLAEEDDCGDARQERNRQREALKRMRDCYTQRLQFVELIDAAEARLRALLVSRTNTDVTEAISVVVELRLKGVPAATRAFDQVLGLVWSRQATIKDAAVEAFKRMHLEDHDAPTAVQSLLEMYQKGCEGGSWTYTHLASVQELIMQAAEKEYIDVKAFVQQLIFALEGPLCPYALRALAALAGASAASVAASLPRVAELLGPGGTAFGAGPADHLERMRLVCQLLHVLQGSTKAKLNEEAWVHVWNLSQHAIGAVVEGFARRDVPAQWYAAAQAAMDLSFDLSLSPHASSIAQQCPDKLWEQILSRMLCSVLSQQGIQAQQKGGQPTGAVQSGVAPICDDPDAPAETFLSDALDEGSASTTGAGLLEAATVPIGVNSSQLGCIVFLAGHLSLRMLIYLEALHSALKRKRISDEDVRMAEQREKNSKKKEKSKKKGAKDEKDEEDEPGQATSMGMAGQEERENEAFADIAEHGLLFGPRSLLDRMKPLLLACLVSPALRGDPILRRLGAIGLCKFMTVSKRFCEDNLQLLFSILFPKGKAAAVLGSLPLADSAEDPAVVAQAAQSAAIVGGSSATFLEDLTLRQSLLVAVGDLLFRHPNVVEPWTGRLYATLGAPAAQGSEGQRAVELRLTALLVLTHLVLNDMMKPRAVLLVRVLWLTACMHESTARVARILFQELSKRSNNVVYNLLPEIIARLPEHHEASGQVEGGAEERVRYVMQFVDKEKHIEGLIEKLTVRLEQSANMTGSGEDVRDEGEGEGMSGTSPTRAKETVSCLSHALGSMNYTDRCILRLHDAVVVRKALLTAISYHEVTRECILGVVEKARKPKPGKEKGAGEATAPEADAAGGEGNAPAKGGVSAAASAALDAIEQTVNALAKGQADEEDAAADPNAPSGDAAAPDVAEVVSAEVPALGRGGGKGGRGGVKAASKRRQEAVSEPGFEEAEVAAKKTGAGRGRGAGRGTGRGGGRGPVVAQQQEEKATVRGGAGADAGMKGERKKRRNARTSNDDDLDLE